MINFEDYINKNRIKFDTEDLSPEHELNFERKLQTRFRKDAFAVRYAVAIAASVIIFIATSVYVYIIKDQGYTGAVQTSQWVEFLEAEQYYTELNEQAFNKLKETLSAQPGEITTSLYSEIDEMEKSYTQLQKDLKNNPNDIRLMSAVIQYYQLKLDLINNLTERFTLYSNAKIKQHEKSNI